MGEKYTQRPSNPQFDLLNHLLTQMAAIAEVGVQEEIQKEWANAKLLDAKARIEEAEARIKELETEAMTDSLTGLPTRRGFAMAYSQTAALAERSEEPFSLVIGDIDRFKNINDTLGHPGGDEVLKSIASVLVENTRTGDFVARFGGEEFIILLPKTDEEQAMVVAEKLREAIAGKAVTYNDESINPTISFGFMTYDPENDNTDFEYMYGKADIALYAAKHTRNKTVYFNQMPPRDGA